MRSKEVFEDQFEANLTQLVWRKTKHIQNNNCVFKIPSKIVIIVSNKLIIVKLMFLQLKHCGRIFVVSWLVHCLFRRIMLAVMMSGAHWALNVSVVYFVFAFCTHVIQFQLLKFPFFCHLQLTLLLLFVWLKSSNSHIHFYNDHFITAIKRRSYIKCSTNFLICPMLCLRCHLTFVRKSTRWRKKITCKNGEEK